MTVWLDTKQDEGYLVDYGKKYEINTTQYTAFFDIGL